MKAWACRHDGCPAVACGVGESGGLRAIGWYIRYDAHGEQRFCPEHRPDGDEALAEREAARIRERFMPGTPGTEPLLSAREDVTLDAIPLK